MNRLALLVAVSALAACGQPENEPVGDAEGRVRPESPMPEPAELAAPGQAPEGAAVQIAPTQGNTAAGSLALTAESDAVRLHGAIQGLEPNSEFGFHIHEKGDCSAPDASSAGGHFNPTDADHGDPTGASHHLGDMPNLQSNDEGLATVDARASGATLHTGQATDVLGKAVVVHESPDDYATQPSGNSGSRIACGVITVQPEPATGD